MNRSRAIVLGLAAAALTGAAALWLARPEVAPTSATLEAAAPTPEPERAPAVTPVAPVELALPEPAAPAADAPELAAPAAQGDTRTAVAIEPVEPSAIVGRLLDDAGEVLARTQLVSVRVVQSSGRAQRQVARCDTDGEGLFRVPIPDDYVDGSARMLALRMPLPKTVLDASPTAVVDLSRQLPPGDTDVGDVRLGQGPPLVSGQVVDTRGEPVEGAQIALEVFTPRGRNKQDGEWVDVGGARAQSDAKGRFVIVDLATSGALAVRNAPRLLARASKDGLTPSQRTPVDGRKDVRLVLRASGLVEGSVIAARGVPLGDLRVSLSPVALDDAQGGPDANPKVLRTTREGAFRFGELASGRWRFELFVHNLEPLVVLDDIWVRAGEVTRDPRLQNMQLDLWLRPARIEVVDASGAPLAQARVRVVPLRGGGNRAEARSGGRGIFIVLIGSGPRDVDVDCAGYRSRSLTGVDGDTRVVLEEGLRLRVTVLGTEPLSNGPNRLGVFVQPQNPIVDGKEIRGYVPMMQPVGPDRTVNFAVAQPGRWVVYWVQFTVRPGGGQSGQALMNSEPAAVVDVVEGAGETVVELAPDARTLDLVLRAGARAKGKH